MIDKSNAAERKGGKEERYNLTDKLFSVLHQFSFLPFPSLLPWKLKVHPRLMGHVKSSGADYFTSTSERENER